MTSKERYDPEDLEQLMRERHFDQLLDEEKAYVLRHMSGAEEYEQVRSTLLAVSAHLEKEGDIEPDVAIKENLMAEFAAANAVSEERSGFTIWLNSVGAFLLPSERNFYAKPAYQLAFTAVLVFGFFFVNNTMDLQRGLAVNEKVADEKQDANELEASSDSVHSKFKTDDGDKAELKVDNEGLIKKIENKDLQKNQEFKAEMNEPAPTLTAREEARALPVAEADEDIETLVLDDRTEAESAYKYTEQAKTDDRDKGFFSSGDKNKGAEIVVYDAQPEVASDATTITQNENAAGTTGYLSYNDSVQPRMGNSVEMDVSNDMLYSQTELEEVQIASASKESRSRVRAKKEKAAPLKSANMRQYSALIGMLHTSL